MAPPGVSPLSLSHSVSLSFFLLLFLYVPSSLSFYFSISIFLSIFLLLSLCRSLLFCTLAISLFSVSLSLSLLGTNWLLASFVSLFFLLGLALGCQGCH